MPLAPVADGDPLLDEPLDGRLFGAAQPCFGCGPAHPHGFRLAFAREGEAVVTRFTPGEDRQGPPGIMHGGLVATVADELAAWAVIATYGKFGFTASFEARYRGPIRIGREVLGRATITRASSRVVDILVEMSQDGAAPSFEGRFRFVVLDRGGAERLVGGPIPDEWQRFCR